jgi:hypothetical protein
MVEQGSSAAVEEAERILEEARKIRDPVPPITRPCVPIPFVRDCNGNVVLYHYTNASGIEGIVHPNDPGSGILDAPSGQNYLTPDYYDTGTEAKERLAITHKHVDMRITIDGTHLPGGRGPYETVPRKFDPLLGRFLAGRGRQLILSGALSITIIGVDPIPTSAGME